MDEDHDRMYVGSKDYILSLDLNDINKEPLIVSRNPLLPISTIVFVFLIRNTHVGFTVDWFLDVVFKHTLSGHKKENNIVVIIRLRLQ